MKILLDECIDRRLSREFVEHEVKTVPQMGWAGTKISYFSILENSLRRQALSV